MERFKLVPGRGTGEGGTGFTEPKGVWKCHIELYYFVNSVLFLSPFCVCDRICCIHVFGFLHVCRFTCAHAYGGPSLISERVLNCFSTSFTGDRLSQSNPELAGMATLDGQLALEVLISSAFLGWNCGWATKLIQPFHGFLGIQIPVFAFAQKAL